MVIPHYDWTKTLRRHFPAWASCRDCDLFSWVIVLCLYCHVWSCVFINPNTILYNSDDCCLPDKSDHCCFDDDETWQSTRSLNLWCFCQHASWNLLDLPVVSSAWISGIAEVWHTHYLYITPHMINTGFLCSVFLQHKTPCCTFDTGFLSLCFFFAQETDACH